MALDAAELDEALAVARRVVGEAAALLRDAHAAGERIEPVHFKSTIFDPVTAWDTRIEDLMRERLGQLSPAVPVLGEERGAGPARDAAAGPDAAAGLDSAADAAAAPDAAPDAAAAGPATDAAAGPDAVAGLDSAAAPDARAPLRWLIDPIDGTVNFSHGLPIFGIAASLEEAGQPVVAVVAAPALGWELWGRRGGGAFCDGGRRLAVSTVARLDRAILATGFPYDRATSRKNFAEWDHLQCVASAVRRFGAASLDLAMVARGWLDGYWESDIEAWDLSAGALLVEEAGGRVTDVTGGRFVSDTGRALATNGAIHVAMLDELGKVRARRGGG